MTAIPSLLKWTGSKRSQASQIAALIPSHKRYYEPFLGGFGVMYKTEIEVWIKNQYHKYIQKN